MNATVIKLILFLAILTSSFGGGWYVKGKFVAAAETKQLEVNAKAENLKQIREQEETITVLSNLEKYNTAQQVLGEKVTHEVTQPVYQCTIPDSGRSLLDSAYDQANSYISEPSTVSSTDESPFADNGRSVPSSN